MAPIATTSQAGLRRIIGRQPEAHALVEAQYKQFNDVIMPALGKQGIVVLNHAQRTPAQRAYEYRNPWLGTSDQPVSVNTVRNYIRSIYEKLHVHSKSEAVSKAIRSGLI
mgnify:CR=1 FL=1